MSARRSLTDATAKLNALLARAGQSTEARAAAQGLRMSVRRLVNRRDRLRREYRDARQTLGRIEIVLREAGVAVEGLDHKAILRWGRPPGHPLVRPPGGRQAGRSGRPAPRVEIVELAERVSDQTAVVHDAAAVQAVVAAAPAAGDEVGRQSTAQAAIDLAAIVASVNWIDRGRAAFDVARVLDPCRPAEDEGVAAALEGVPQEHAVRARVYAKFEQGYATARREATRSERAQLITRVAADAEVVALSQRLVTGPHLAHQPEFVALVTGKLEAIAPESDAHAAALADLRSRIRQTVTAVDRLLPGDDEPDGAAQLPFDPGPSLPETGFAPIAERATEAVAAGEVGGADSEDRDTPATSGRDREPAHESSTATAEPPPALGRAGVGAEHDGAEHDVSDRSSTEPTTDAPGPSPPAEIVGAVAAVEARFGYDPHLSDEDIRDELVEWMLARVGADPYLAQMAAANARDVFFEAAAGVAGERIVAIISEEFLDDDSIDERLRRIALHDVYDQRGHDIGARAVAQIWREVHGEEHLADADDAHKAELDGFGDGGEPGENFEHGAQVLVPSSVRDRIEANIAAIRVVAALDAQQRPATPDEQQTLARWSGWGGAQEAFDDRATQFDQLREELYELLSDSEIRAARLSTLNAHYTDPAVSRAMWAVLARAGMPEQDVRFIEPGCGAGMFLGQAPAGVRMCGVELDPVSARIAHYLYPAHEIRNHGFERDFAEDMSFDGGIGNVPFGDYSVFDDRHNLSGMSIHNHFIVKTLALTRPGGYVAVITSTLTSDGRRTGPRQEMAELADLIGAVRLPSKAFARQAATDVMTDVLLFRRREPDTPMTEDTKTWLTVKDQKALESSIAVNAYYFAHRQNILGRLTAELGPFGPQLVVHAETSRPLGEQITERLGAAVDIAVSNGLGFTATDRARTPAREPETAGLVTGEALAPKVIPGTMRFDEVEGRFEQYAFGAGWVLQTKKSQALTIQWKRLLAMGDTVMALVSAGQDPGSTRAQRDVLRARLTAQYDAYLAKYGHINRYEWTKHAPRNTDEQAGKKFARLEDRWRHKNGEYELDEHGDPVRDARNRRVKIPVEGPLPDDVAEELWERSYEPDQAPYKKRAHLEGAIRFDPRVAMVRGIEIYDDDMRTARKSSIFTTDASRVPERAERAESVDEAIAIAFDELGHIAPARIAELLGVDVPEALYQARGKIFPDLDDRSRWVLGSNFLSGHVRAKLALAEAAAATDPDTYGHAVEALRAVVPEDTDPSKIGARPGAAWLGIQTYREFFLEEFGLEEDEVTIEFSELNGSWYFQAERAPEWVNSTGGYGDPWGDPASDMSGMEMFSRIANNQAIQSRKTKDELERSPKPPFHPERTEVLQARARQLQERFASWLWEDPDRNARLTRAFNDTMNSFVEPRYDTEHKKFPGLNPDYRPYPYQKRAAVRQLHEPATLLDHEVGSGKTLSIAMASIEMVRLGQTDQPWVIVPNGLISQWQAQVQDAYPGANVLVATDLEGSADRQRFIAQTAVGEYDLVLVPMSTFGLIPVDPEWETTYLERVISELEDRLTFEKEQGRTFTVKQIEKALSRERERHTEVLKSKRRDKGLTFRHSGCTFLWVDEAHLFKNLTRTSQSEDLALLEGSQRATDLEMKALYLYEAAERRNVLAGRPNAPVKVLSFATGTPESNSMAETWVMTRFLRRDLLAAMGMRHIDPFAQVFAKPRQITEMNITATKVRTVSRMAEYHNLPQLWSMLLQYRDVVTSDDIPAKLPTLERGERRLVEFELPQQVRDFMADLDDRQTKINSSRLDRDNHRKISSDAQKASLYPPLAHLDEPAAHQSRITLAANLLWDIHVENLGVHHPADKLGPECWGAFQLVFCDMGTPKANAPRGSVNLYTQLRDELVALGFKPEEVAFIHDHPAPRDRQLLYAACQAGRVRVLIGSTEKMGMGMNVQRIAKTLLHLTVPMKSSDLKQRGGRVRRQGNRFESYHEICLVAAGSYDAVIWQIVERKAFAEDSLRRGNFAATTMEEIGTDLVLSAAQTKAIATGDPIYVAVVDQEAAVKALQAEQRMISQSNLSTAHILRQLEFTLPIFEQELRERRELAAKLTPWIEAARDQRDIVVSDGFDGSRESSIRDDDTAALAEQTKAMLNGSVVWRFDSKYEWSESHPMFRIAGVDVFGRVQVGWGRLAVSLGDSSIGFVISKEDAIAAALVSSSTHGFLRRVRNLVSSACDPSEIETQQWEVDETRNRIEVLRNRPEQVFTKAGELFTAEQELYRMRTEINARENSPQALAREEAEYERRSAAGLYPGWSLDLNPTRAWAERRGMTREELIASVPWRMRSAAAAWAHDAPARAAERERDPWRRTAEDGSEFHYGGDADRGRPGAMVSWTGLQWAWHAWDGRGQTGSGEHDWREQARRSAVNWVDEQNRRRRDAESARGANTGTEVSSPLALTAAPTRLAITMGPHRQEQAGSAVAVVDDPGVEAGRVPEAVRLAQLSYPNTPAVGPVVDGGTENSTGAPPSRANIVVPQRDV
ncbi:helicase-related protein [Nocardia takedensis]|uniref:helicase-related protein n=1 Tax=Nocardia takedensis TaxID=259390 RepID=UPI003F773DF6